MLVDGVDLFVIWLLVFFFVLYWLFCYLVEMGFIVLYYLFLEKGELMYFFRFILYLISTYIYIL